MTIRPLLSLPLLILGIACSAPSPQDASTSTELPAAPSSPSAAAAQAPAVVSPHAPDPAAARAFQRLPEAAKKAYLAADLVVVARLEKPRIESILEVAPPIFVHAFDVVVDQRLGGSALPARLSAHWSTRDRAEPWPADVPMIVALTRLEANLKGERTRYEVVLIEPHTAALEAAIASARAPAEPTLSWSVRQIAPASVVQWSNEYGDGEFELTLRNDGSGALTVPGLFTSAGKVHWVEALIVRDEHGREIALSKAGVPAGATPVVLSPGETLATRVDVKPLGLLHPPGGGRVEYSFGLGELRTSSFFYYTHTLHGPLMGKP
jgi:hypothetical protein